MNPLPCQGNWKRHGDIILADTKIAQAAAGKLKTANGAGYTGVSLPDKAANACYFVFESDVVISGNLMLGFDDYDPEGSEIYELLETQGVEDDAYFVFLGDLRVEGSILGPTEDPCFLLLVEGDLYAQNLCCGHAAIMGSVFLDG